LSYFYGKFYLGRFHSKSDTLKLYKNGECLAKSFFKQKGIPRLKFYLGNIRDSIVTKQKLVSALKNDGIYATYKPDLAICNISVRGQREVYIRKKNGKIIKLERKKYDRKNTRYYKWDDEKWDRKMKKDWRCKYLVQGNSLSKIQIRKVKRMKKGDILIIPKIISTCPSCMGRIRTVDLKFIVN